jgi:hypothetical protein
MEGKILTPADLKMRDLRELKITFREDAVTHQSLGLLQSFRYRIDPAKTPKEIDMELTRPGTSTSTSAAFTGSTAKRRPFAKSRTAPAGRRSSRRFQAGRRGSSSSNGTRDGTP